MERAFVIADVFNYKTHQGHPFNNSTTPLHQRMIVHKHLRACPVQCAVITAFFFQLSLHYYVLLYPHFYFLSFSSRPPNPTSSHTSCLLACAFTSSFSFLFSFSLLFSSLLQFFYLFYFPLPALAHLLL